ncbi:MAG: hypothetical protein AAF849_17555 [Bacteroidota bacterium]
MIQKDYIERMTQQVAKVLARLIGKDWEQTLLVFEQVYEDWMPIEREDLIARPPSELLDWLVLEEKLSLDELEAIAYLLYTEGAHLLELDQQEVAFDRLKKAFLLLEYVDQQADTYSFERAHRIGVLREQLE